MKVESGKERCEMLTKEFTSKEMIAANQLRTLSQKEILEKLAESNKIGVIVKDELRIAMIDVDVYEALLDRLREMEERFEELVLADRLKDRVQSPESKWIEFPEGMAVSEFYKRRKAKVD
jgi:hypothetical protein